MCLRRNAELRPTRHPQRNNASTAETAWSGLGSTKILRKRVDLSNDLPVVRVICIVILLILGSTQGSL